MGYYYILWLVWLSRFKFKGGSEALERWLSSIRIFNKGNIPDYLQEIIWIDDDFLSDDKLDFEYDAFELIDSKVSYLNPKHFSVYQMVCALKN